MLNHRFTLAVLSHAPFSFERHDLLVRNTGACERLDGSLRVYSSSIAP